MKKLDDLVFKNLHGLKDEEDEAKHKHDKKSPADINVGKSDDPFSQTQTQTDYNKMLELQQQQQLMYSYYMMQQRQQQQQNPQFAGNQMQQLPPFNPALLQNMQNMQNMQNRQAMQGMQNIQPRMGGNVSSVNNPFAGMPMGNQANQFAQMNRVPQQGQMPQNQYAQMYQNQMGQAMHSGQAVQFGQMNQGFPSSNQNFAQYQGNTMGNMGQQSKPSGGHTNNFDDFGDFSTSSTNPQQNKGHNVPSHDDFADFQGASHGQQHKQGGQPAHQNFGQNNFGGFSNNVSAPADDFDDFQDSTSGKAGLSTTQASTVAKDDFDDFQGASASKGQNWDMLDDFIEKKPETVPTEVKNVQGHPQQQTQQAGQTSHFMHGQANVNMPMSTPNVHLHQGMQNLQNVQAQPNFFGAPQMNQGAGVNMNFYNQGVVEQRQGNKFSPQKDEDEFADFEEAKPTTENQPKPAEKPQNTKEDLLFGALENKVLKQLGYSQNEIANDDDFGGFDEAKVQQSHGNPHVPSHDQHHRAPEGDDFDDFEQATTAKVNSVNTGHTADNRQENMAPAPKLSVYDVDWAEFGITENVAPVQSASQGLTGVQEEKPQESAQPQHVENHEDFGDFVEINDENEKKEPTESHNIQATQPVHSQGQGLFDLYGQGESKPQEQPHSSNWTFEGFGTNPVQANTEDKAQPAPNDDDEEFNDFEGPQVNPKEDVVHIQEEGNDFDDFQVVGSAHNKNNVADETLKDKKETEQNKFEGFEFEKPTPATHVDDWYKDFMPSGDKEAKPAHINEQQNANTKTEFADLGFNFSSVTISAGDKQTTIYGNLSENKVDFKDQSPEPPVENVQQNDDEDFDDFEEYKNVDEHKKEEEKFKDSKEPSHKEEVKAAHKIEEEEDEFGEFGGETKTETKHEEVREEEHQEETPKEDYSKKLTVYDIDFTEFGIPEDSQPGLPKMDLNLGGSSQMDDNSKKVEKKLTGINDLYSLYENTSATPVGTPITTEQPKAENLFGETLETQNIQDTDQTGKHAASPEGGNDDFDDFEDFSAAPKQTPHKESSGSKRKEDHDDDFGNFEGTHKEISPPKREPKVDESQEADDFDNFEEAGHTEVKHEKGEIAAKSLSQFEGHTLQRDVSDFGSLNDVGHHDTHHNKHHQQARPRGSTELDRGVSLDVPEKEHDDHDFGSFANAGQKRQAKDESLFHPAESSDYSPAKEKDKDVFTDGDEHNEEFGDFVASKHDIKGKTQEVIVEEMEQFTLEGVLAEYEIKDEPEPEEVDLTNYIEKRVEDINREYNANLFNTSYARTELTKPKFKLNRQIIEETVKELSSLQKYKEASACEGQLTVLEQLEALNETKRQLIEDEKLEEAIQYRDLIKNKEKEVMTKEKLDQFLSHYNAVDNKADYRVHLLEELKAAQVPINYINDFCVRFIGNLPKIIKKTNIIQINHEVKPEESPIEKLEEHDSYHKIEAQQPKDPENEEGFGDFEDNQTPTEKIESEVKPVEEGEEKQAVEKKNAEESNESFDDFENANQVQAEKSPEIEKDSENKIEPEKKADAVDEDFGDFEDFNQPEAKNDQEEKGNGKEGSSDFENIGQAEPSGEPSQKEEGQGSLENKNESPSKEPAEESDDFKNSENEKIEKEEPEVVTQNVEDTQGGNFEELKHTEDENAPIEQNGTQVENEEIKKEEIENNGENKAKDESFEEFEQSNQVQEETPKEQDKSQEKQLAEGHEDEEDFGDFEGDEQNTQEKNQEVQPEVQPEVINQVETEEHPQKAPSEEADEGFGDFEGDEQNTQEKNEEAQPEAQPEVKQSETEEHPQKAPSEEADEGFGDFEGDEQNPQEKNKEVQPEVINQVETAEHPQKAPSEEVDLDFGDFEGQDKAVEVQPEEANPIESKEQNKAPSQAGEAEENFGDFEGHEQNNQEKIEEVQPEVNQTESKEQHHKVPSETDEDFGDFNEPQPQAEIKEENQKQEKGQETDIQVAADGKESHDDFGDFEDINNEPQVTKATTTRIEVRVEVYSLDEEEIEDLPEAPKNFLELQNLKEETIKWALLAKAIGSSGSKFDNHIKNLLNQIVFELHRFIKFSEKVLNDANKNSVKMVITSEKYETYIKGIQVFISFYKELKTAYEFLNTRKQPTKRYQKPLEELIEKVHNIRSQIEQDFGKDYTYDLKNENDQDLLLISEDLNAKLLAHVCHLSLKIHNKKLTEYSGKHYFLPYLNFLLNIS